MADPTDSPATPPGADGPAAGQLPPEPGAPDVQYVLADDVARVTVVGELTEAARRPLVRAMTDLLLSVPSLRAVRLDVRSVSFMNSAGMAVLVQLQRMADPRGIEVALVRPPTTVARPLQLSGLWRRFSIVEEETAP